MRDLRTSLAIALAFLVLTCVVTYPQVRHFGTSVPYHSDPYFSMWRLGWVAHALVHSPRALFEANIFYPAHDALAYSDAMVLPAVFLAPLFWLHLNPVAIYNGALFASFALSGWAMFLLARRLTGDPAAAIIAGVIYAFAPYRLAHYAHLELQMVFWIPLALLSLHRIVESPGGVRQGLVLGTTIACQILSCIYGGVFLAMYCAVLAPCLLLVAGVRQVPRVIGPLIVAAVVATILVWPYAATYLRAESSVGTRSVEDVARYSATLTNYLSAPAMNRLYGSTAIVDPLRADEMNLFPGIVALTLAVVGLLAGRGRIRLAYFVALMFAFSMTRGINSFLYRWLFEHVSIFSGLRSAARFDLLVTLSLAVLSAYGAAFIIEKIGRKSLARVASGAIGVLLIVEYASSPVTVPVPAPSQVDALLAEKPPAIIVELPLVSDKGIWGSFDWLYMYQGMPHFQRMLNGYSGYAPVSLYEARDALASFPDDRSLEFLREREVDYIVVRIGLFEPAEAAALVARIQKRPDLSLQLMSAVGSDAAAALYALRR